MHHHQYSNVMHFPSKLLRDNTEEEFYNQGNAWPNPCGLVPFVPLPEEKRNEHADWSRREHQVVLLPPEHCYADRVTFSHHRDMTIKGLPITAQQIVIVCHPFLHFCCTRKAPRAIYNTSKQSNWQLPVAACHAPPAGAGAGAAMPEVLGAGSKR